MPRGQVAAISPASALMNDGARAYAYDGRDRLIRLTADASVNDYGINIRGQRVMKSGTRNRRQTTNTC